MSSQSNKNSSKSIKGVDDYAAVEGSTASLDPTTSSGSIVQVQKSSMQPATTDAKIARGGRVLVMAVLFISAVTVSTLAYILLSKSEKSGFKATFESSANQVILMANRNAANVFMSVRTMAAIYPTAAMLANASFPFVTLDGFEKLGVGFRNVSKASRLVYAPILRKGTAEEINAWSQYSVSHTQWIDQGYKYLNLSMNDAPMIFPFVHRLNSSFVPVPVEGDGLPKSPIWQVSPPPDKKSPINFDGFGFPFSAVAINYVMKTGKPFLSEPMDPKMIKVGDVEGPMSLVTEPVFDSVEENGAENVAGTLVATLGWKYFFDNTLPDGQNGIQVVTKSCDLMSTFVINGPVATFLGYEDLHDHKYNHMKITNEFISHKQDYDESQKQCRHYLTIYPTQSLEDTHTTDTPRNYAIAVVSIFVFAAIVFMAYDWFVTNRQFRTERQADQSNAIVQELFPGDTANRLFGNNNSGQEVTKGGHKKSALSMSGFGKVDRTTIAELHPDATVLFADISGFTAWSSIRDPHQVFTLLESIFQAFDAIAKRCGVFKVETVGDCYVAACGVPEENLNHAVVMCRFARHAMLKFRSVCRSLELLLGPDTSELALRIGMHSGPVTAGVLRGDRARFQLFGDTVNTASRIESTGMRERVHLSEQTANQLIKHGKENWIVLRNDVIEAKGKGRLVTYWLKLSNLTKTTGSVTGSSVLADDEKALTVSKGIDLDTSEWNVEMPSSKSDVLHDRNDRLVEWNSDLLLELLENVVSRRRAIEGADVLPNDKLTELARTIGNGFMVVEEVAEIIDMPKFACATNCAEVELTDDVKNQLRGYIAEVASMYNNNPFHNFEHASHVTMSIHKLLTRIVAPKLNENVCSDAEQKEALLHDHTCGITSDPLTQFAVVLSGLIHDLDHPGVSNGQLVKENPVLATRYQEKSVAEQNSVDLAWNILMSSAYDQLRNAIFATKAELQRFRSLLVNSVIATDIFDKDQSTLRKNRWNKAFFETTPDDTSQEARSRKATIVIEHLIQASDVAHTMQHWHVYQKWNQRLFNEMMMAYRAGRSDKDPSLGWYGGELWFFDNYVIPLTKKLKECGVFGVSSDEYLNYALHNRDEWEAKGKDVVQQYLQEFESMASKVEITKQDSTRFMI